MIGIMLAAVLRKGPSDMSDNAMKAVRPAARPNILLIYLDDLGWRDLACYGSSFYESPAIDRLAEQGIQFSQAYASCPVCSPSRASLLTGRYPARVGLTNWIGGNDRGRLIDAPYIDHLPLSEYNLARALHDGGYQTWHIGKWHLGGKAYAPQNQGFERNIGGCHMGHPWQGYFAPWQIENLDEAVPGTYLTDQLTDEAIRLVQQRDDRPFFLNFWHYAVHTPIEAPQDDVTYFREKAKRLKIDQIDPIVIGEHFPTERKRQERLTRRIIQSDPVYAAMIKNLDSNIGRLLATLEREGILDQTAIILTSDNGGLATSEGAPTCNAPLAEGKGWMYEGGVREPLIICYPELVRPGSHCPVPVTTPDIYPTCLELAGLPLQAQQHVDGVSMLPLLRGADDAAAIGREAIFWHYPHYGNQGCTPAASVRWHNFKLIRFFEDERLELYDLNQDIAETVNLAAARPQLADQLSRLLDDWLTDVGARLPLRNPDYPG